MRNPRLSVPSLQSVLPTGRCSQFVVMSLVVFALGCASDRVKKVDNPVAGPAPPRKSLAQQAAEAARGDSAFVNDVLDPGVNGAEPGDIVNVSGSNANTLAEIPVDEVAIPEVIATVNGTPIFSSELLRRHMPHLEEIQAKAPPYIYNQRKMMLLKFELSQRIEQLAVYESVRSQLKKEQMEQIDVALDQMFENEVNRLKKSLNVGTRIEVDEQLQKDGSSLRELRQRFGEVRMSSDFIGQRANAKKDFSRQEIREYYEANKEKYEIVGKVRWQQLEVHNTKSGGKIAAGQLMNSAVKEIRNGASFDDVCVKYSHGLHASEKGIWEWQTIGSFADEDKEKLLFALPVGHYSNPTETERGYILYKVLERQEPGFTPFADVQSKIESMLIKNAYKAETARIRQEMIDNAVVEKYVDLSKVPDFPEEAGAP